MDDDLLSIGAVSERTGVATLGVALLRSRKADPVDAIGRRPASVFERRHPARSSFIRVAKEVGLSLDDIAEALASLPEHRTPTKKDWERLVERLAAAHRATRFACWSASATG